MIPLDFLVILVVIGRSRQYTSHKFPEHGSVPNENLDHAVEDE
jgi:hypothetical protein